MPRLKRLQFYAMPLGTLVQSVTPRWLALHLARLLTCVSFPFLVRQRQAIEENRRRILGPESNERAQREFARRVLVNRAVATMDLVRAPLLCRGRRLDRLVAFQEHRDVLDRVLDQGRAAILVTCHVGNWDLAGIYVARDGYPIVAVYERIPRGMSDVFNRFRRISGMGLVGMDERRRMSRALQSGKLLVLLGDRDLNHRGQELPWFRGRRTFPRGAAALALRCCVPVVIGYFVLEPGDRQRRYRLKVESPVEFTPSGDLNRDIDGLTACIVARLESVVRRYPDQWFVFQPDWLESGSQEVAAHA